MLYNAELEKEICTRKEKGAVAKCNKNQGATQNINDDQERDRYHSN